MAEKLSKTSDDKPDYIRPMQKFQNLKAEPTVVPLEGGSMALSAKDVAEIDKDVPARQGPIIVTEDVLGFTDPVRDVSEFVSYRYYQCTHPMCSAGKNGKPYRVFAGAGDHKLEIECACIPEPRKPKTYQNPKISVEQYEHGVMKLFEYRAPRGPLVKA